MVASFFCKNTVCYKLLPAKTCFFITGYYHATVSTIGCHRRLSGYISVSGITKLL